MASYSSNANVQNAIYGDVNAELDVVCSNARDLATSIINAKLGLKKDLTVIPDLVHRCCTLLAMAIISTSPEDKVESNTYWVQGMILLDSMGDELNSNNQNKSTVITGFGRSLPQDHDLIW